MILNSDSVNAEHIGTAAGRIAAEIDSVLDSSDGSGEHLYEVAAGVAAYVAEAHDHAAYRAIHPRALASRALNSVGRSDLAGRLMVFGGGLVRRVRLSAAGDVWVLDLGRLSVRREDRLDMMLNACLSSALGSMAYVWDNTNGRGILGLKNLKSIAIAMTGHGAKPVRIRKACREIRDFCGHKLANMARARKWTDVPFLMMMDHG